MKELSIFVDESGDFGEYAKHSPFYIITMILHDQSQDISGDIAKLRAEFINLGYEDDFVVHTGPLILKRKYIVTCFPTTGGLFLPSCISLLSRLIFGISRLCLIRDNMRIR